MTYEEASKKCWEELWEYFFKDNPGASVGAGEIFDFTLSWAYKNLPSYPKFGVGSIVTVKSLGSRSLGVRVIEIKESPGEFSYLTEDVLGIIKEYSEYELENLL